MQRKFPILCEIAGQDQALPAEKVEAQLPCKIISNLGRPDNQSAL